ncbi:hypothetical protein ACB092_03G014500 [Castanea dentata]
MTMTMVEARHNLHRMLNEAALRDALLLVFPNKKDLPNAVDAFDKLVLQSRTIPPLVYPENMCHF